LNDTKLYALESIFWEVKNKVTIFLERKFTWSAHMWYLTAYPSLYTSLIVDSVHKPVHNLAIHKLKHGLTNPYLSLTFLYCELSKQFECIYEMFPFSNHIGNNCGLYWNDTKRRTHQNTLRFLVFFLFLTTTLNDIITIVLLLF